MNRREVEVREGVILEVEHLDSSLLVNMIFKKTGEIRQLNLTFDKFNALCLIKEWLQESPVIEQIGDDTYSSIDMIKGLKLKMPNLYEDYARLTEREESNE